MANALVKAELGHPYHELGQFFPAGWLQASNKVEDDRLPYLATSPVERAALLELLDEASKGPS
ncbi:MAG: hypothetical protein ACLP6E_16895 [Acidimicrobiales bacterium]